MTGHPWSIEEVFDKVMQMEGYLTETANPVRETWRGFCFRGQGRVSSNHDFHLEKMA
ncbi:MAG TPA: hypothetical protein VGM05_03055 [Planctomycetaceae bacterium]|jgi:hypothetical protein